MIYGSCLPLKQWFGNFTPIEKIWPEKQVWQRACLSAREGANWYPGKAFLNLFFNILASLSACSRFWSLYHLPSDLLVCHNFLWLPYQVYRSCAASPGSSAKLYKYGATSDSFLMEVEKFCSTQFLQKRIQLTFFRSSLGPKNLRKKAEFAIKQVRDKIM